ncbi:MAG: DNA repair protein RecN [Bacteroidales bacterium]|nr:DNA repair protein RecN [Bacteroidales bacterium]
MLSGLQVRNYVLIDSLEISFPEGLIIITGQTGAGKSILLGALGLIMGSKADASMLSEGADSCVVEADFDMDPCDADLKAVFDDNDVEWDEGHIVIRRVVSRSGRSRAFVNDCPVPVQVLQDLSSRLIDIHSQHQTLLLSDRRFQLETFDYFAGTSELRGRCAGIWKELSGLRTELSGIEAQLTGLAAEKSYNEAQFRQLEAAVLRDGELEELEKEQKRLANAEEIKRGLYVAEELFTNASSSGEVLSMDSALKEAVKCLSRTGKFVPAARSLAERVESCRLELDDVLAEICDLNSGIDVSESRLKEVEDRMSLLYSLMQKHGCANEAELISYRDRLSEALFDSTRLEDRKEELLSAIGSTEDLLRKTADKLHEARLAAVNGFSMSMTSSIRGLELPYAVFEVELQPVPAGPSGIDSVQFAFSSTGRNAVDLAKCASGGEMSRIMLALKAMRARFSNMPTMIFDEIDTGVSGSVADRMGAMICEMGAFMQVFAITHLPQVAAKGKAHYLVSKEIDASTSKAVSSIMKLSEEQRVLELARMLSGSVLTDAAIANAKSLMDL